MKIYLVGPITGLSYDQVMERYKHQFNLLKEYGYQPICPMVGKDYLKNERVLHGLGYTEPASTGRAIKGRDQWMVRQSDILLADFTDSEVASIGSCMELAWADILGKHVIAVIPEVNIHRHAFVTECADIVFTKIEEAYAYLKSMAKGI